MLNFSSPLNFFKKKPIEPPVAERTDEPVVEKKIQIDDIAIHVMPERFRHEPAKAHSSKTTGLLIIGGGSLVLILVSVGLYYFLIKEPPVTVKSEPPAATVAPSASLNENQPEIDQNLNLGGLMATTSEPVVTPDEIATSTASASSSPETIEEELTVGTLPGLDSDADGLTDAEEVILGTSTSTPDTDGDLYSDGAELQNLYDPAGPGKLSANPALALYENKTYNYSVLYPVVWQLTINGGDDSIMLKSFDNQFFQIIIQANLGQESLDQWYMDQLDMDAINESDRVFGPTWQGLKSLDGLTLYLMDLEQKNIFTLAYNPGENNILEYQNIFNMMIKSFTLKESAN